MPDEQKAREILGELFKRHDLLVLEGISGVYVVDVPYANLLDVSEEQIVQEADPRAVFGFLTAMTHHGLTDLLPKDIHAIQFEGGDRSRRLPLGTMPEDWADGLPGPLGKRPTRVKGVKVHWTEMKGDREFGITIGYSAGLPVYVTDVERTLVDAIRMPEKCGGIAKVLHAWRNANDLDVDKLVGYTDRYGIQNLRQRVGFLLERLGRPHPRLGEWRARLQRGGSVKLVASEAYSGTFSAEWNLSLNVPAAVLGILE